MTQFKLTGFQLNNLQRIAEEASQKKKVLYLSFTFNSQLHQIQMEQPRENTRPERQVHNEPSIGIHSLGLFDTSNPVYDPAEEELRRRMQKKKKKRSPKL